MEFEQEIKKKLGEETLNLLFQEIRNGKVTEPQIKFIGLKMSLSVNGIFEQKRNQYEGMINIFYRMLDEWYKCEFTEMMWNVKRDFWHTERL